jgi:olefin beta-lactone synthetase
MFQEHPLYQNFAEYIIRHENLKGSELAISVSSSTDMEQLNISYKELIEKIQRFQKVFDAEGFKPGEKVIIMLPVSIELFALVISAMANGIIPVLINPGMSRNSFLKCISKVNAQGLIAVRKLLFYRWFLAPIRKIRKKYSFEEEVWLLRDFNKISYEVNINKQPSVFQPEENHSALITFTSGSSGVPKGVNRTHKILIHQHLYLKSHFTPPDDQIDMPCFPVLTLHNLCLGVPTYIPPVNFGKVGEVDPEKILKLIQHNGINTLSGAPAYLGVIVDYLISRKLKLPGFKGVVIGGAPVEKELCDKIIDTFPSAKCFINYGSSESEPVSSIEIAEYLNDSDHFIGYCVGKPIHEIEVKLLSLSQIFSENPQFDENAETGEICVAGNHVCKSYYEDTVADKKNKISCDDKIWHRTGDIGYIDGKGRIYLVARKDNLIINKGAYLFHLTLEKRLNSLPFIKKAAMVQKEGKIVVSVIPSGSSPINYENIDEMKQLFEGKVDVDNLCFKYVKDLPLDTRHNSKIEYHQLIKKL